MEANRTIPAKGSDVPARKHINAYVRPLIADVWYDLGLQLLDPEDETKLDTIKNNNPGNANGACTEMFSLWLHKYPLASWNSLISTIKGPGVEKHDVACKIEQMLQPVTTGNSELQEQQVVSQMERERKSTNEATELLKQQIQLYKSDLDAARQSREETNVDNAKLKHKIKDMEDQFHKIRDGFTTERTSLAAENSKLKEEIEAYEAELVVEKQTNSQLTQDNITLRKQITEKDERLTQYDEKLKDEKAKEELRKYMYGSDAPQLKKSSYIHSSGYIPPSQQISTLSPFKQSQPVNSNASSGQLTEFIHKNQRKQKVDYSIPSASRTRGSSSGVRYSPYSSKSRSF